MVYFSKKQATSGSATISGNNTFTGTNTFTGSTIVPNPTANNQATNKSYVDSRVVFIEKNNFTFHRQQINTTAGNQVTKYYTDSIPYANIAAGCSGIISIACSDIPVSAQHLVITYFPKRLGNNALIEVYQYNSDTDITNNLHSANFQFVIQKSA